MVSYSSETYNRMLEMNEQNMAWFRLTYAGGIKLFLFHIAKVFKQLFPTFSEEPRFITAAPWRY